MFVLASPKVITAEVFARLPDELRKGKDAAARSQWVQQQHPGDALPCFLEGPSFDRAGNLYCVDIPYGRVFRVSPQGAFSLVAEYDGEPNGLKIHKDGRIFIADHKHGIMRLDPGSGKVTPLLDRPRLERFIGVNDLHFAANGDLYFTDQGQSGMQEPRGALYRLRADGRLERLLNNVPSPNGLCLNARENTLYLAVTRGNCVWRVRLLPDGALAKTGIFIQLSGGGGPDGLALNEEEGLAIAHVGYGAVWVCDKLGDPVAIVRPPEKDWLTMTNVAYGGPDRRDLYITESHSGTILRARLDVPGRPLYSHA